MSHATRLRPAWPVTVAAACATSAPLESRTSSCTGAFGAEGSLKLNSALAAARLANLRPRRDELCRGLGGIQTALLERRDVVHDVEAAAIGGKHDVVRLLLNDDPAHRRVRQAFLQRLPGSPSSSV